MSATCSVWWWKSATPASVRAKRTKSTGTPSAAHATAITSAPAKRPRSFSSRRSATDFISGLQGCEDFVEHLLRVAEQHAVVLLVEERIVDPGVARGHAALHDDRGLALPHFQHRHAGDRTRRIF